MSKVVGGQQLAPQTSPKKTIPGSLAGILLTTLLVFGIGVVVFPDGPNAFALAAAAAGHRDQHCRADRRSHRFSHQARYGNEASPDPKFPTTSACSTGSTASYSRHRRCSTISTTPSRSAPIPGSGSSPGVDDSGGVDHDFLELSACEGPRSDTRGAGPQPEA